MKNFLLNSELLKLTSRSLINFLLQLESLVRLIWSKFVKKVTELQTQNSRQKVTTISKCLLFDKFWFSDKQKHWKLPALLWIYVIYFLICPTTGPWSLWNRISILILIKKKTPNANPQKLWSHSLHSVAFLWKHQLGFFLLNRSCF